MAHVQIVLCPKCQGQKHVNKPPWVAGDQHTWTSSTTGTYPCPVCDERGYLVVNAEPT